MVSLKIEMLLIFLRLLELSFQRGSLASQIGTLLGELGLVFLCFLELSFQCGSLASQIGTLLVELGLVFLCLLELGFQRASLASGKIGILLHWLNLLVPVFAPALRVESFNSRKYRENSQTCDSCYPDTIPHPARSFVFGNALLNVLDLTFA